MLHWTNARDLAGVVEFVEGGGRLQEPHRYAIVNAPRLALVYEKEL